MVSVTPIDSKTTLTVVNQVADDPTAVRKGLTEKTDLGSSMSLETTSPNAINTGTTSSLPYWQNFATYPTQVTTQNVTTDGLSRSMSLGNAINTGNKNTVTTPSSLYIIAGVGLVSLLFLIKK